MDQELAALATTAATKLVEQVSMDGWERARAGLAALWDRVHPGRGAVIEADLADTHAAVLDARDSGDEAAERELVTEWISRLRRLLLSDPSAEAELRRMLAQWAAPSPASTATDSQTARVDLRIRVSDHGTVTAAGRDVYITPPE